MKYHLILPLLLLSTFGHSQSPTTYATIGTVHQIESKALQSKRSLSVYLPQNYHQSDQKYPVLYVLDGQWYFSNGVAIQQSLRVPDRLPEMIVVGIHMANPLRNTLLYEKRQQFLEFIKKEVLTYIEDQFRVSDERLLFGWESSAFFGSYVLLTQPELFDGVIITNGADPDTDLVNTFTSQPVQKAPYLFIANSRKDIFSIQYSDDFAKALKNTNPDHLQWKYQLFNDEQHESLPYLALYHGLNYYYHNYGSLVFASIEQFNSLGGMDYLHDYFKNRSQRFGFANRIDDGTKNNLIWLAWNRNDFKSFDFFMHTFKEVLSTKRYDSAYWQNRFAQFYLQHKAFDQAIKYFNAGIKDYPQARQQAQMHAGIAEAYWQLNEHKPALLMIKKAIKLAQDSNDTNLASYQHQLSQYQQGAQ